MGKPTRLATKTRTVLTKRALLFPPLSLSKSSLCARFRSPRARRAFLFFNCHFYFYSILLSAAPRKYAVNHASASILPERARRSIDAVWFRRREEKSKRRRRREEEGVEGENIPMGPVHIPTETADYVGFRGRAADLQCAVPNYMLNFN